MIFRWLKNDLHNEFFEFYFHLNHFQCIKYLLFNYNTKYTNIRHLKTLLKFKCVYDFNYYREFLIYLDKYEIRYYYLKWFMVIG